MIIEFLTLAIIKLKKFRENLDLENRFYKSANHTGINAN